MTAASSIASAPPPRDSFGCTVAGLDEDRRIDGAGLTFYRKKAQAAPRERVHTPANNRGYLLGLSLSGGHRRRILHEHHETMHEFDENSVYLRNFHDPYQADLSGSFDFVLLEVGHSAIERMADCADLSGVRELCAVGERADPVLGGLMAALFADMNGQLERSPLFVDQLSVAIGIHVAQHYGSASHRTTSGAAIKGRRLSARSLSIVQELMRSRLGGDLSIEELAEACHLSQGTFLRAFRQTLGITPFQWFLQQRLDRARDMLEFSSLTIGEIAVASGFADQSHFTRVFARATGASPGAWRRSRRA